MPLPLSLIILKIILLKQVLNIKNMKDNYPMGAALDPSAPYNQPEDPKPVDVSCCVSYSLSKTMPVKVENYYTAKNIESDIDSEGNSYSQELTEECFDNTNFIEEFNNDENAIGIPTLLKELKTICQETIDSYENTMNIITQVSSGKTIASMKKKIKHLKCLIKASEGWIVDDLDVCQE